MPEIPLTTVEQMLIELSDILTYKANLLTIVDEIRTEALVSEEVLTGKYATIIGLTLPNIKTYEAHNSSDQRTMHGGYRDTQLFTGIVRIDVLTSNGEKDTYCRHVSTYIQQYIIDHTKYLKIIGGYS
jgi:hypothetical protein